MAGKGDKHNRVSDWVGYYKNGADIKRKDPTKSKLKEKKVGLGRTRYTFKTDNV